MLFVAGVIGLLIGWVIAAVTGSDGVAARVAWSGPVALLAAAAILGCVAYVLHQRLQVHRIRIDDRQAVTWLALGKAAAIMGAVMAGGYAGFAVRFLPDIAIEAPRERVIRSVIAIAGAIALMIAALRIERSCQAYDPDDEDPNGGAAPTE